jgi:ABC-type multidrug transport system ATPase subunit
VIEQYGQRELQLISSKQCVETRKIKLYFKLDGAEVKAVDGVSLAMFPSEIFALLGHNGAGKTTLISVLTGLLTLTGGSGSILGFDIEKEMDKVRKSLGFCPQHDVHWPTLTVYEHLRIFGALRGSSGKELTKEISILVAELGLSRKLNSRSSELSGGMKRRLSIAIAFAGDAKFVILDEPTSGLDPFSRRSLWDFLKRKKEGKITCLSTHYMDEADILGDRIGIMTGG